ncbi:MAG: 50S ribosome-binding GTPase [Synergistaceae bacterium]|nr:50S ribosome-binding GTPase [Synergistaceae bacterium]MBQ3398407.1 50S ribosome-binding GTPase [Synergistaceae bacterium]MBQ6665164.1 50S ribosome-binding GTPase [Synergistaceae bacterium]MBQ6981654.1 50S ribosome-binding GTPase [Synergistaceae bacterium]MBR0247566.1 50S ribosome-binding GTPase [Synergistaceae bacterium]
MLNDYRKHDIDYKVRRMGAYPLDVMLIGATGTGKSTTLNTIFGADTAKVGNSFAPETMDVTEHRLNNILRFWDTPGLGDSIGNDKEHSRKITAKLRETYHVNSKGNFGLIDLVLVVIDGSTRDLGTVYTLFVDVLLPNIQADRILTVINQCDMAMSGRHWDYSRNVPDSTLLDFLNDQVRTITRRISETTGKNIIPPVYYSAEYGYNIERVLDLIIDHIPLERRKI